MREEIATEALERTGSLRLARTSLVFGIISLPLAFLVAPGLIAIIAGYRARRRLLELSETEGTTKAFVGMALGLFSFFAGAMIIFALPTTNLDKAHRTTVLATTVSIESAVDNFYTEYGKMPDGEGRVLTGSAQGVDFLKVLLGLEGESAAKRNVRDIKFLSVREGKNRKNGLSYGMSGIPEGMFDAYGNAYTVFLKGEGEGNLRFRFAGRSIELEGRRAAAVSPGKDGKLETPDDIKSW